MDRFEELRYDAQTKKKYVKEHQAAEQFAKIHA